MTEQWEYRVVGVASIDEAALNRLGAEGWELIAVRSSGAIDSLILKRPAGRKGR